MVNTYVVAPNFSMAPPPRLYRPDESPPPAPPADRVAVEPFSPLVELQLGDVLTIPFGAEMVAINSKGRVPIDTEDLHPLARDKGFSTTRKELLSGRLGLWASLLAGLGVGPAVNLSIFLESRTEDVLEVTELQTRRFRVTPSYVKDVLKSQAVVEHLKEYPTSHVYIVSGIKVAKGAKGNNTEGFKVGADIGADGGGGAADLKLLKFLWHRWKRTAFKTRSDFILAVQLWHVKLSQKEGNAAVATLSTDNASLAGRQPTADSAIRFEAEETDDSLAVATRRFGRDRVDSREDGSGDVFVLPLLQDDGDEDEFEGLV